MQNCCKKWEDVKVTPKQLKKIARDTKDFLSSDPKKPLDKLFEDNRKVLIPDVRNQTWLVHIGKFYEEMIRLKRKAEKTIGILSTGLNTYICTQPIHGCTTACVGGGELMFYMPFILSIKSDDVAFVYGHELYHTYQDIPVRIISHINNDSDRRYKLYPIINGRLAKNPTPDSIIKWYSKNHDLINIAADFEDNYILQRVGLADEEFLTGGDSINPRFCYKKEYGKKPFEEIFDELSRQDEMNRAKEKEFKPKKKTIINGPVIIEDPDEDADDDDEEDDDDSQDGTTVIDGPVHVSDNGKKPKGDPGEIEINGPIIDNRTKKPEDDDPFPGEIGNDGKNNSDDSPGKSEKDEEDSEEGDGNDSEDGAKGSEGTGNGSGDNSEGSEGAGNGSGDNSEGSEGSEDGSGESGSGNDGKNVPSKGEGGGGHGNKDIDSKIEDAKKLSDAIDEWIRRRTGVSEWKGGLFSGTLAGTLSPKEVERCMRTISSALSAGTITKLKGIITHSCETIVSGVNKQGRWGSRGHLWKKEVRPYSKSTRADAKINLVYMFDNSGSMGAPLICSFIDCLIAVWKEYEDVIEKIVMIPMRSKFRGNDDTNVIICSDISKISSAKLAIIKIAGSNDDTSFNTAIAVLKDPKIINPSDYNVFLNVGDREWKRDIASVPELCDLVRTYCRRNNFDVKDMFVSCLTQLDLGTMDVGSEFDRIFDSYGVNTIKMGKEARS